MMLLVLFLPFLSWIPSTSAQHMPLLNCNTLTGDFNKQMIRFAKWMEVGDKLTFTGKVGHNPNMSYINLYTGTFNSVFTRTPIVIHVRAQYRRKSTIYNSYFGKWGPEEFGSQPFVGDSPYSISILRGPRSYRVYNGNVEIKNYALRHPVDYKIGNVIAYGDWSVDTITMTCKNPPPTTTSTHAPTTTTVAKANPIAEDPGTIVGGSDIVVPAKDNQASSGSSSNSNSNSNNNNNNSNNGNSNSGNSGNGNSNNGNNNSGSGTGNNGNGSGSTGNLGNGNGNNGGGNGNGNGNGNNNGNNGNGNGNSGNGANNNGNGNGNNGNGNNGNGNGNGNGNNGNGNPIRGDNGNGNGNNGNGNGNGNGNQGNGNGINGNGNMGNGINGQFPYPPPNGYYPPGYPYPPGFYHHPGFYYPPGGYPQNGMNGQNGQNGNGQPNIIVINSDGSSGRKRGGNMPQFDLDNDDDEDC